MSIHAIMKETMETHKSKIELIQWAVMGSIASLVYSEYIRSFRQKTVPNPYIQVPSLKNVQYFLESNQPMMTSVSEFLFDDMSQQAFFYPYISRIPELVLFQEKHLEILKTILDLYMIPNIQRRLPEVIAKKFQLDNPDAQTFRESNDLELFQYSCWNTIDHRKYLSDQTILQLLMLCISLPREVEVPEQNISNHLAEQEVLSINNMNAITPIHFTEDIIQNKTVIPTLSFVTNTQFSRIDQGHTVACKGDRVCQYQFQTSPFNQVTITRFATPEELDASQPESKNE